MQEALKLVIPKNFSNDEKGKFFEQFVGTLLTKLRYGVIQRVRFTGMEIDLIAQHKDTNEKCYVECKFQNEPLSAGVLTDLLGKALIKDITDVFLFSMSDLGKEAKGVFDEYSGKKDQAIKLTIFLPEKIFEIYVEQHHIHIPEIGCSNEKKGMLYLIVTPNTIGETWVQFILNDGVPTKGYAISTLVEFDLSIFKKEMSDGIDNELSEIPLEILPLKHSEHPNLAPEDDEIISEITSADSFHDYRPCRPTDYVGRDLLQKQIWDFLDSVRDKQTAIRIVSISGPSGYGKSSTIIKLADRFKNIKWKSKFYIYHVDVRSAKSSLYIHKSIRKAIDKAAEDGFLSRANISSSIERISNIFQSEDLKKVISELKTKNKVLVIFFDQFEELFTKIELFATFEMFKRVCLEVDALKENIVLGFSWRTGISFNDNHPAYHLWHELDDKRKDFSVKALSHKETSHLISVCL